MINLCNLLANTIKLLSANPPSTTVKRNPAQLKQANYLHYIVYASLSSSIEETPLVLALGTLLFYSLLNVVDS